MKLNNIINKYNPYYSFTEIICWNCHEKGHPKRLCPHLETLSSGGRNRGGQRGSGGGGHDIGQRGGRGRGQGGGRGRGQGAWRGRGGRGRGRGGKYILYFH